MSSNEKKNNNKQTKNKTSFLDNLIKMHADKRDVMI